MDILIKLFRSPGFGFFFCKEKERKIGVYKFIFFVRECILGVLRAIQILTAIKCNVQNFNFVELEKLSFNYR